MKTNKNNNSVIINKIIKSRLIKLGIFIGEITAVIPKIHKILNMFEPTIFPIAKSVSFLNAAVIETTISGREVPIAIIVAEIRN